MLSKKAVYGIAGSVSTTVSLGGGAVVGFRRNSQKPIRYTNQVHKLVNQGHFEFLMCAEAVVKKYEISFKDQNFHYKHDTSNTAAMEADVNNAKTFFTNKMKETCKSYLPNISDQELTQTIHNLFDSHKIDQEFGGQGGHLPTTKQQRAINEYGDSLVCLKKAANSFFIISKTQFTYKGVKYEMSEFNNKFTQVAASCSAEQTKTTQLLNLYKTADQQPTRSQDELNYDLISYLTAELPQDGTKLQKVKVIDGTPSSSGQCNDFSTHIKTTLDQAMQVTGGVKLDSTTYTEQQQSNFISALTAKLTGYSGCTLKTQDDKTQIDEISDLKFTTLLKHNSLSKIGYSIYTDEKEENAPKNQ